MTYNVGDLSPIKRHWIAKSSNIPMRFWGFEPSDIIQTLGQFPQDIDDWLSDINNGRIIKNPGGLGYTGVGLLFDGKPGMGKTTHAVTTLMQFIRTLPEDEASMKKILHYGDSDLSLNSRPVYYLTMTDLLHRKKSAWDDENKNLAQMEIDGFHGRATDDRYNVRLLVLDDLGKEYGSKYDDYSFDDVARSRYDVGLPTIITTNTPLEQWKDKYSAAMESFAHEAFRRVTIGKGDIRKL